MTPLGHVAVAICCRTALGSRGSHLPRLPLVVGALAPDLDALLLPLASFNAVHRVISHNLFFVALVAITAAVLGRRAWRWCLVSALLGGLLHLLVDAVMDNNPTNGLGVAWLWPASDAFLHPFNLVPLANNPAGWGAPLVQFRSLIPGLIWELPFELYLVVAARAWWRTAAERGRAWLAARALFRRDSP